MWAVGTASVLLLLAFCGAEDLPLKWSKPASERTNGDWVPLSTDQLGQASARSLGPPPQQNHLVHGVYEQENPNSFAQPFHQQQQFRQNPGHQQEKFIQPHILSQQFLPPQIPSHLLAQQLPPQFLNQQFENNFNPQISHARPILRPQFVVPQEQFSQTPVLRHNTHPQQHSNEYIEEQKDHVSNFQSNANIPQHHSFAIPQGTQLQTPKALVEPLPVKKDQQEEKEEVQILYVPVETLKQRGRGVLATKGTPTGQTLSQSPIPSPPKESKKFRHPIQPLKDQVPAVHSTQFSSVDSQGQVQAKPTENPVEQEYDSVKDTTQQQITTSQLRHQQQSKFITSPLQQEWDSQDPTIKQTNFRNYESENERFLPRPKEPDVYDEYSELPTRPVQKQNVELPQHQQPQHLQPKQHAQHSADVYHDVATTKLPPPNQPPLSVYMETSPNSKVGDVLSLLKDAKTIPVLDTIGPDSPQVFVGPSNLKPPHGYVKFELPYLSSLDGNRVERKVLQLPFFVAPLNFQPPPGYSKIPFPPPHIGSVVLSNNSARAISEKYAVTQAPPPSYSPSSTLAPSYSPSSTLGPSYSPSSTLAPSYSPSSTFRDPYTIPADISSISPQLPSLINSLQEEQLGITTPSSTTTTTTETPTEPPTETTAPPTRRPPSSRRNNYRGSHRAYSTTSTTPLTRRPYGQRQRRPYNSRTQSRYNQITTSTTTTTEESQPSTYDDQSYIKNGQEYNGQQFPQDRHLTDQYSNINLQPPTQSTDDSIATFVSKQTFNEEEEAKPQYNSKSKVNDENYRRQEFVPQYNPGYVQGDFPVSEEVLPAEKNPATSNRNFPNFPHVPKESFTIGVSDVYQPQPVHREQEGNPKTYSLADTQFPASSIIYEHNRQTVKEHSKEETLPVKHHESDFTTTESSKSQQQYKVQPDELSYTALQGDVLGQVPQYSVPEYKPIQKDGHFTQSPPNRDYITRPVEINNYKQEYSPSPNHGINYDVQTTQPVYDHTSRPEYQYVSQTGAEKQLVQTPRYENKETLPTPTEDAYKTEAHYSSEEQTNFRSSKHRLRGRPTLEHKTQEYETRTTTEQYAETTTPQTERPTHSRGRNRVRGRPFYTRQKTTTEAPNYPSIYTENKVVSPTESYKEDKRISLEQYSVDSNPLITNYDSNEYQTTQATTEATTSTRALNKKFSHSRTLNRRPLRPASNSPVTTTTNAPPGTKYLIRTRRPTNAQTKLHTGRSRIRRPTKPTTTTTTDAALTEMTEKWTVPQLPNLAYKDDYKSQVPTKINQYDSFSRSPFTINANNDDKIDLYQNTPVSVPDYSGNIRIVEKPKPTNPTFYNNQEEDINTYTTKKPKLYKQRDPQPTLISYDDANFRTIEPTRNVNPFNQRESHLSSATYNEDEDTTISRTYESPRKTHHRQRDPQTTAQSYDGSSEERNVNYKSTRGKQRGHQPVTVYHEENFESNAQKTYETTRKPLSRHREQPTTPKIYVEEEEVKTNLKSYESPVKVPSLQQTQPQPTLPPFAAEDDPYNQNYKGFATTRKSPVYKTRGQETAFEDKYIPDKNPALIPDYPEQDYKTKSKQDAEDFWNQAVTIQQSKSYVYMPDAQFTTPTPQSSKSATSAGKSAGNADFGFNEYDDYFNYQESGKFTGSDQAPFPSNDQHITYTGIKPGIEVGKESQYPEKEISDGIKTEENVNSNGSKPSKEDDDAKGQVDRFSIEPPATEATASSTENPFPQEEQPSNTKKPGRRRGTWVRVRVKKPKDVFETAESQRFGSLTSNTLQGNQKLKIDSKVWDTIKVSPNSTAQETMEKAELLAMSNGTNGKEPTIMEQFQNTLTSMITSYMNSDEGDKNEKTAQVENSTEITTETIDITTIQTTTEEDQPTTTEQPTTLSNVETEGETTTDVPNTVDYNPTVIPKVLGTSTTTEISLETEICFRGRCVKTKRTKGKEESDLMTVE